jgi:hypothetical protein
LVDKVLTDAKIQGNLFLPLIFAQFAFATLNFDIFLLPCQFVVINHYCPLRDKNKKEMVKFSFWFCPFCCCFDFAFTTQLGKLGLKQNIEKFRVAKAKWAKTSVARTKISPRFSDDQLSPLSCFFF